MRAGGSSPELNLTVSVFMQHREGSKTEPVTEKTQQMTIPRSWLGESGDGGGIGFKEPITPLKRLARPQFITRRQRVDGRLRAQKRRRTPLDQNDDFDF